MDNSKQPMTFIKYSPKRENLLSKVKDNMERETYSEGGEIPGIVKFYHGESYMLQTQMHHCSRSEIHVLKVKLTLIPLTEFWAVELR